MKITSKLTILAMAALCGSLQAATTDPMGGYIIDCPNGSDTRFSLTLYRPAVFEGVVDSVNGNEITFKGTPGFTADEFVYSAGVQTNTYFVLIMTGPTVTDDQDPAFGQPTAASLEGSVFMVTDNGTDSVTVNLAGGSLDDLRTEVDDGTGDSVQVIPYWTLNTLFPEGEGFADSTTFTPAATIFFPDNQSAGINLSSADRFFYYSGSSFGGEGWRKVDGGLSNIFDDELLFTDVSYIVRNESGSDFEMTIAGGVPMTAFRTPINTIASDVPQDNFVGMSVPVDMTLSESRLYESGAFTGSSSFTPVDILYVYDNDVVGQNKSSSASYFYYEGAAFGGPGWRAQGDFNTIYDDVKVLKAGVGFIIRKAGEVAPGSTSWATVAPYLLPED